MTCVHILYQYLDYQWIVVDKKLYYVFGILPETLKLEFKLEYVKSKRIKCNSITLKYNDRLMKKFFYNHKNKPEKIYTYDDKIQLHGLQYYFYPDDSYKITEYNSGYEDGIEIKYLLKELGYKTDVFEIDTYDKGCLVQSHIYKDNTFKKLISSTEYKRKKYKNKIVKTYHNNNQPYTISKYKKIRDDDSILKWCKHGDEFIYDKDGKLIETKKYNCDKVVASKIH
jgi:hypothetical protein